MGEPVVVTEKLDGSNTLLHAGKVYGRSVSAPSEAKWMALVKKHHAWKVMEPDVYLYGEEHLRRAQHRLWAGARRTDLLCLCAAGRGRRIRLVQPSLRRMRSGRGFRSFRSCSGGSFGSVTGDMRTFMERAHGECSVLGGEREGVVVRLARGFPSVRVPEMQSAKAFVPTMCNPRSIGPGTGGRAESPDSRVEVADRRGKCRREEESRDTRA